MGRIIADWTWIYREWFQPHAIIKLTEYIYTHAAAINDLNLTASRTHQTFSRRFSIDSAVCFRMQMHISGKYRGKQTETADK